MDSQHVGFYAFSYFLPPFALHLPALPTRLLWSVSPSDKFTSLRSSPSGFADKIVWSVSLFAKVSSAKLVVLRIPCKSRDRSTLFLGFSARNVTKCRWFGTNGRWNRLLFQRKGVILQTKEMITAMSRKSFFS